jgi:large subunit ribosomal protein L25
MSRKTLEAQKRKMVRKLKSMLEDGMVPGVVYDQKGNSENIKMPASEVKKLLDTLKGTPLINLDVEGKTHIALLKEVQIDHRQNTVSHLSFMSLDPKKEADFEVEIIETGESPAVKNNLGLLIFDRSSVELRGLPEKIPNYLKADISKLEKIGDSIIVSDLDIPDGLEFITEEVAEYPVATIRPFQKTLEEELKEEEEAKAAKAEEELTDEELAEIEGEEGAAEGVTEGEEGETAEAQPSEEAPPEE